jgi:hypothetical protein
MEEGGSVFKTLTGKPTRKITLGRAMRRKEYIRMYLKEIGKEIRGIGLILFRIEIIGLL